MNRHQFTFFIAYLLNTEPFQTMRSPSVNCMSEVMKISRRKSETNKIE